ncbi:MULTISPECIES: hypothetical protein [Actinomadura]|uniref:Uncharacterized protein n=1 Tax=Actinomadura litoris TaxID=2678616 RepID=A0A7K1L2B1_9ACTN|nr:MULTISPECIES: hypothetical protein [Actinomadura]MBT2206495.1 hypothetical protein [Actinomadura sp. NEAU-AAG7]MUN38405.1 hypothetical protein [Actinomadura litoris]
MDSHFFGAYGRWREDGRPPIFRPGPHERPALLALHGVARRLGAVISEAGPGGAAGLSRRGELALLLAGVRHVTLAGDATLRSWEPADLRPEEIRGLLTGAVGSVLAAAVERDGEAALTHTRNIELMVDCHPAAMAHP